MYSYLLWSHVYWCWHIDELTFSLLLFNGIVHSIDFCVYLVGNPLNKYNIISMGKWTVIPKCSSSKRVSQPYPILFVNCFIILVLRFLLFVTIFPWKSPGLFFNDNVNFMNWFNEFKSQTKVFSLKSPISALT